MAHRRHLPALFCAALAWTPLAAEESVWWEGENPADTNIQNPVDMSKPGNRNDEQQAKLSGGRWLTVGDPAGGGTATITYQVEVPAASTYDFWTRKFWKHGPFKWRFGDGEWQTCGKDITLHDSTYLQKHWGANWVFLGQVELDAGEHTLEIEMIQNKGCFDAFLLINGPFSPRGKLRPGEKTGLAEDGYFAWEPDKDPLTGASPLNLRHLNEEQAGIDGFVSRDGDEFRLANGEPVRFWMVQGGALIDMQQRDIDRWAKRLAKYGVNLVRLGNGSLFGSFVGDDREQFARELDKRHYVVAALKREGIYTYFGHLYWHTKYPLPAGIIPGFDEQQTAIALPFVSEEYREFYRDYISAVVTPENPYTGGSLADEPALAFLEIHNESSLLFHTFSPGRFSPAELAYVEKQFGDWLIERYGSLDAALEAWGPSQKHTPDHPEAGRIGLYGAGFLGGASWAVDQRNDKRAGDQLQWMVESMRDFYASVTAIMKEDIGVGQMITASNWKTADDRILGALERHSYTPTDAVLRNSYFATKYPNKEARQRFYAIEQGDTYASVSGLKQLPGPLATPLIAGHPFMITENNWTRPNRFRAEWPVLIASYARMQGVDGWNFFALDSSEWQAPMDVWDINNPTILGQFPATALMYRRGDVSEPGQPAVHEYIGFEDAFDMEGTQAFAVSGKDAMWAAAIGEDEQGAVSAGAESIDPRAYFVGPVRHEFRDGESTVETVDLDEYIDDQASTVRSLTGELTWNYDTGLVTIDTPRAQGATGFLKDAGRIELGDVVIESANEYGSILVVALDGKPIAESQQVLVQTATEDRPHGFTTESRGEYLRITDVGGGPLNVKRIDATVTVHSGGNAARVLDGNGNPTDRRAESAAADGGLRITLPADAIYTLIE